jgi:protochlorophyllide reductase
MTWSEADIPDQSGRTIVVTGSTGGLGLRVAEVLAARGARVILTARNPQRGAAALARVTELAAGVAPAIVAIEMTELGSVRAAADSIRSLADDRIDVLVSNAGFVARRLEPTPAGVETQWATNVFGPWALTWLLLPAIENVEHGRVVSVSSLAHFDGAFDADRLAADSRIHGRRTYPYYARSKLADLLLSRELHKYFVRVGAKALSVAAHPGLTRTGISAELVKEMPRWVQRITPAIYGLISQPVEPGAHPLLFAATAPSVEGGQYFGPDRWGGRRGAPTLALRSAASESDELGGLLLDYVESATDLAAPR